MCKGIIMLLPKKGKDTLLIKNLRPLTLLNTDYKILAKIFINRLKTVLPDIIGEQQTGFMSGHHIYDNIRKTMDIVSYVNRSKTKAVIVSIDFEKCFDHIEHNSIIGALRYFGIGEYFVHAVKTLFHDFILCTQNAGYVSANISKGRGIHQGCPIARLYA